jgi:integrase/recombinase XerD
MPQARTLKDSELKRALAAAAQSRHSARSRIALLMSFWAGMRVGEIAALKIGDVVGADGSSSIRNELWLKPEQTKGKFGRKVMIGEKLQKELAVYIASLNYKDAHRPLIYSQRSRTGFSSNSLGQEFIKLYERAGLDGATSHSGRRTFITNLANKGIGVRVLQALAGHRSIATTQLYIDVNDEMMKMAVEMI